MAREEEDLLTPEVDTKAEKQRLKEERKKIKDEQKAQKKEAKQRAKEISKQEAELSEDEEAGGVSVFLVTLVIVIIWIGILCLLIKLDVGGFGSGVLAPVLKDVPVINKILPSESVVTTDDEEEYGGYTSLREAVDYIKELELEIEEMQSESNGDAEELEELQAEVERLQTFEDAQVEFERIKTEFYEEVVYAENGPGAEEYQKYYESMDPTTAEYLYKQVVQQLEADEEIQNYAQAYAEMKPKEAAGIFEEMTDDLELAAKILNQMSAEDRGKILGVMDPEVAARLTKIMDPDS
jgi:flagellar motility protein MotE (MotC chaperone)